MLTFSYVQLGVIIGVHLIRLRYFHPLSKYPGPWFHAISEIPVVRLLLSGKQFSYYKRLHEKYGKAIIVYITPPGNQLMMTRQRARRQSRTERATVRRRHGNGGYLRIHRESSASRHETTKKESSVSDCSS